MFSASSGNEDTNLDAIQVSKIIFWKLVQSKKENIYMLTHFRNKTVLSNSISLAKFTKIFFGKFLKMSV